MATVVGAFAISWGCVWRPAVAPAVPAPPPANALAWYNASSSPDSELLGGFDAKTAVTPGICEFNGWGFPNLVRRPPANPGRLAAFEDAAPLGFGRDNTDAAVIVPVKKKLSEKAVVSGILDPAGLKFRQPAAADQKGNLSIPLPAACLAPGDYTLKIRLESDGTREFASLPLVVGPYIQRDRFHTYYWNAGGSNEKELAEQMKHARLAGINVLDTAYLPALNALRGGMLISAHYVTVYAGDLKGGYAAVEPYLGMARDSSAALGVLARRYPHIVRCIPNSEYGSDRIPASPDYAANLRKETGLDLGKLRLDTTEHLTPSKDISQIAPGVYPHDLPELKASRFARHEGVGWFRMNRLSMEIMRRQAPDLQMWTDPVFTMEQFDGLDAVAFWQYENSLPETMAQVRKAECAKKINKAKEVFLTLSQWYAGVKTSEEIKGIDGEIWGLKSPDQHRAEAWLSLAMPIDSLGYWQIYELEKNPDCADALKKALTTIIYPYGTMLKGTSFAPAPVAIYVSSDGEFLDRAKRPRNFWYNYHYLNGVRPALFERFKGQIEWVDDADVLAGRLKQYRLVLCPIFRATTDKLLAKLKEYQAAGGIIAGDELWQVEGLKPDDIFPGRDVDFYGIPYANEHLPKWHKANRDAILKWNPKGFQQESQAFAATTSSPDAICALRETGGVRYAALANCRFQRGGFADKHGYINDNYLDQGVGQSTDLTVKAPGTAAVYDVVNSRPLTSKEYAVSGDCVRMRVKLPPAGGAIFAFYPVPIATVLADAGTEGPVPPGTVINLTINILDESGKPVPGNTAVRYDVFDSAGSRQDVSGFHPVRGGIAQIPFGIPLDAQSGKWTVKATDLTSGLQGTAGITVGQSKN